jgi:hypothetical protein
VAEIWTLSDFMFMKRDRILGILWAVFCSSGSFNLFRTSLSLHPVDIGQEVARYVLAFTGVVYLAGIVAGVFLFRGARWARWFVGSLAGFVLFSGVACILLQAVLQRTLPVYTIGPGVFALVSLVILLLPRHEPVAGSVVQHKIS